MFNVLASEKVTMPDGLGHAVGPERFEMLAKLAGVEVCFQCPNLLRLLAPTWL